MVLWGGESIGKEMKITWKLEFGLVYVLLGGPIVLGVCIGVRVLLGNYRIHLEFLASLRINSSYPHINLFPSDVSFYCVSLSAIGVTSLDLIYEP